MRHINKMRIVALILVIAMLPVSVSAAPTKQEQQDKLNEVQNEIKNLDELKKEIDSDLSAAVSKMETLMNEQAQLQARIDDLNVQLEATNAKMEEIRQTKAKNYEAMKVRIQYMYENGMEDTVWNSIVSSKTIGEILTEIEYCQTVYSKDRQKLEDYEKAVREEEQVQQEQYDRLSEILTASEEYLNKQEELGVYIASLQEKSDTYATQIARAEDLATTYEASIRRLEEQERNENSSGSGGGSGNSSQTATSDIFDGIIGGPNPISLSEANLDKSVSYLFDSSKNPAKQTNISQVELIEYALQFVGNPYVWGGNSLTKGADCSGFVKLIYQHFGIETPRYSQDFKKIGKPVGYENLQPGDIIVYPGHVALYVGDGKIVEAQSKATGITCYRMASRSSSRITAIRRVL